MLSTDRTTRSGDGCALVTLRGELDMADAFRVYATVEEATAYAPSS